MHLECH